MQGTDGTLQLQGDLECKHRADDALNRLIVALHVGQNNGCEFCRSLVRPGILQRWCSALASRGLSERTRSTMTTLGNAGRTADMHQSLQTSR